ncbi:hypothetical protein [Gibbsiella quercinecans]|uniref:hypothetical protein n=1 Tax=Gibbsiella quercinecans TaxID=929813 RepID=UPI003A4D614C
MHAALAARGKARYTGMPSGGAGCIQLNNVAAGCSRFALQLFFRQIERVHHATWIFI